MTRTLGEEEDGTDETQQTLTEARLTAEPTHQETGEGAEEEPET